MMDLKKDLLEWNTFYVAGRLQPFLLERIPGKKFTFPICCSKEKFNYSSLSTELKKDLDLFWRDIDGDTLYYKSHLSSHVREWMNYGTCSGMSQEDYFKKGIEFSKKYNIQESLLKHHIEPSFTEIYSKENITDAIEKELKITPVFGCFYSGQYETPFLNEMSFFLNKNFEPIFFERLKWKFWTCNKPHLLFPYLSEEDVKSNPNKTQKLL